MLSGEKRTLWNIVESSSIFVLYLFNKKKSGKKRINWVCMETKTEKALIPRGASKLFQELSLLFFAPLLLSPGPFHRLCANAWTLTRTTLSAPVRSERYPTASTFRVLCLRLWPAAGGICSRYSQLSAPHPGLSAKQKLVQNVKSKPEIRTVWKEYFVLS